MSAIICRITSRGGIPCVEFINEQHHVGRVTIEDWTFERDRAQRYLSHELASAIAQRMQGAFPVVVFPPEQPETTTETEKRADRTPRRPS